MRRIFSAALLTLGLALGAVGLLGSVLAGPDDTVGIVTESAKNAVGMPLIIDPSVTAFTGVDLVVTAQAEGPVFIGAAHEVDLTDLVIAVEHFKATRLLPRVFGGIDGAIRSGEQFLSSTGREVTDLDVWRRQASGDDEQQLVVPLRDEPTGVLVHSSGVTSPLTVAFAVRVPGLFAFSLVLSGVGAGLMVLWWVLRRRARHSRSSRGEWSVEDPLVAYEQSQVGAVARRPLQTRRVAVAVAMGVGALTLNACAAPTTLTTDTPSKVALTAEALPDLVAEYNDRNAAAAKKARYPSSDARRWSEVFDGPLLDNALFITDYEQLFEQRSTPPTASRAGDQVWSPAFKSYPMWAFAEVDGLEAPVSVDSLRARKKREAADRKAGKKAPRTTNLVLFTRQRAEAHWRAFTSVPVLTADLPAPITGALDPNPDDSVLDEAQAAASKVESWWRTGKEKGLTVDAESRRVRPNVATFSLEDDVLPTRLEFKKWSEPEERLRLVPAEDGHLLLTTFRLRVTLANPGGETLSWRSPTNLIMGHNKHGPHTSTVVTNVVHLPDDGEPRLLGSDIVTLRG